MPLFIPPKPLQQSKNKNIKIVAVSWSIIHALFNINKNNANLQGSNPPHPNPATGLTGPYPHPHSLCLLDMIYPPFLGHGFNVVYSSSSVSLYS